MADPEETKKVTNLLSYMSIVKEIEDIPIGGSSWREDNVTPLEVDEEEPSRGPYRWVMTIYESPKFPSLCAHSIDIQAESVYCVADEVWKATSTTSGVLLKLWNTKKNVWCGSTTTFIV
jgi:hypothetical protein